MPFIVPYIDVQDRVGLWQAFERIEQEYFSAAAFQQVQGGDSDHDAAAAPHATFNDRSFDLGFLKVTNGLVHGEHTFNGRHCIRPGDLHDGSEIGLVFHPTRPRLHIGGIGLEIAVGLGSLFAFMSARRGWRILQPGRDAGNLKTSFHSSDNRRRRVPHGRKKKSEERSGKAAWSKLRPRYRARRLEREGRPRLASYRGALRPRDGIVFDLIGRFNLWSLASAWSIRARAQLRQPEGVALNQDEKAPGRDSILTARARLRAFRNVCAASPPEVSQVSMRRSCR